MHDGADHQETPFLRLSSEIFDTSKFILAGTKGQDSGRPGVLSNADAAYCFSGRVGLL
jgi:hypothetical protein